MLGCSTDLAPDKLLHYDICFDEVNVAMTTFIMEFYDIVCLVVRFCVSHFLLPAIDFTAWILCNVQNYFQHNVYIWLLFYKHCIVYEHTNYGVRSYYSFRKTFFARGVLAVAFVLVVLLCAFVMDTRNLSGYG